MYQIEKVSTKESLQLIDTAILEAEKINRPIAIAVCGPEGELISFLRMDGASPAAAIIAQNKAYTAARDRRATRHLGQAMLEMNRSPTFWGDSKITGLGGGLPLIHEEKTIGGIGISGLTEDEDERIARIAIKTVYG